MTRQLKTIVVLAVEAGLLVAMVVCYLYFVRSSRDFIAAADPIPAIRILHNRPR